MIYENKAFVFLENIIICLSLILKQSLIWRFNIYSVLKACKNYSKNVFFQVWLYMNVSKSLIRRLYLFPSSPIINKSTCFFRIFLSYINWMFYLFQNQKHVERIIFFIFVYVSNFDLKLYVFKMKPLNKVFVSCCNFFNSCWIMICPM